MATCTVLQEENELLVKVNMKLRVLAERMAVILEDLELWDDGECPVCGRRVHKQNCRLDGVLKDAEKLLVGKDW